MAQNKPIQKIAERRRKGRKIKIETAQKERFRFFRMCAERLSRAGLCWVVVDGLLVMVRANLAGVCCPRRDTIKTLSRF